MTTRLSLAVAAVAALTIAGCGGGGEGGQRPDGDNSALRFQGEERAAAQTVEDYVTAIRSRDWERICRDLYSAKQADLTKGILADSCEEEVDRYDDLSSLELTVNDVTLETSAEVATTTTGSREAFFDLVLEDGEWRIDGTSGDFTAEGKPTGDTPPGSGDEAAAAQVVLDFDRALADRDWQRLCALHTEEERSSGIDGCPAEMKNDYSGGDALGITIDEVTVDRRATVRTDSGNGNHASFTLVREGGRWRIDSYGGTFGNS